MTCQRRTCDRPLDASQRERNARYCSDRCRAAARRQYRAEALDEFLDAVDTLGHAALVSVLLGQDAEAEARLLDLSVETDKARAVLA